jgi:hypothetical protein
MKADKTARAEIIAFYVGGAKVHATTTLTKVELESKLEGDMLSATPFCKIDTVNEDPAVADDSLTLLFDKMLFFTIFEKNDSKIITAPGAGKIIT